MNITNLLYNKYYIIRTGDFATNANKKIIYITLGLGLCFHDYNVNHTMEYYYVMFGSSFIWTLIELFLNQQQIRIIKPMKLNINGITYPLNKYIGITLQGIQEGGVVTIIGLYFGDRFYSVYYQTLYHLLIAYMIVIPGAVSHPRFRVPLEPLLSLFFGVGLYFSIKKIKKS